MKKGYEQNMYRLKNALKDSRSKVKHYAKYPCKQNFCRPVDSSLFTASDNMQATQLTNTC